MDQLPLNMNSSPNQNQGHAIQNFIKISWGYISLLPNSYTFHDIHIHTSHFVTSSFALIMLQALKPWWLFLSPYGRSQYYFGLTICDKIICFFYYLFSLYPTLPAVAGSQESTGIKGQNTAEKKKKIYSVKN